MQPSSLRNSHRNLSGSCSDEDNDGDDASSIGAQAPVLRRQTADAQANEDAPVAAHGDDAWAAENDAALLESLCTRLSGVRFDQPEQWERCFQVLAHCRHAAARAAHTRPQTKWLAELARTLVRFLEDFERHVQSGAIDLRTAGSDTAALIGNGLGMLSELVDCRVYSAAAQKPLRAIVMRFSAALAESVMKSGVAMDREGTAAKLALLTWFSRGLKARLLQHDDASIRGAFGDVLEQMVTWAENPAAHGLDGQQLAACFVQLNTIRQFGLLPLEGDGRKAQQARERLQSVLKALCGAVPKLLTANGVTVANICNTLKDYLDAGLLPKQTHGWLMPVLALLLQRIPQISRADLVARGGQVLANFSNFLRALSEPGLHEQPAFVGCAVGYRQACSHLIEMLRHPDFRLDGDPGQSLANLMSFIKAMARLEVRESEKHKAGEKHKPGAAPLAEESAQRRSLLRAAARQLLGLVETHDEKRLSPMSIGGLLSAIGYLWACRIAPADACHALTQRLFAAIPKSEHGRWDEATTALCLRAMVETQRLAAADAPGLQLAFVHLLQLLQKSDVKDETHRLYCLQALRLGLQQKWVTEDTAAWRQALRTLLGWKDAREPGLKELEAAVAGLAHRDEAAPAVLETTAEAPPPQPLPGEVGWTPPGGKLATLSSAPAFLPEGAAAKHSTTYRAPVDTSAGSFVPTHTTSTNTLSSGSSVSTRTSQAPHARQVANAEFDQLSADPVTRWFELASGDSSDDATLDALRSLAKGKPALIHALDRAGNSALYYLIVSGKRKAMAWLIEQPGFSLGMPLDAFNARIDTGLFGSKNWNAARLAREDFDDAARRLFGAQEDADEEPRDEVQAAAAAKLVSPTRGARASKAAARSKAEKRGKAGKAALQNEFALPQQPAPSQPRGAANAGKSDADKLEQAFKDGDVAGVRRLLRSDAGRAWARTGDGDGTNRLTLAVESGNARMVEALLEVDNGALAEHFDLFGKSALLYAAEEGNLEVLKLLIKFDKGRLALQQHQNRRMNVLALAVERGHADCVKFLLAWNGGKLLGPEDKHLGRNAPLEIAATKGHVEVVRALLEHNDKNPARHFFNYGLTAVSQASCHGHADVLRVLLQWRGGELNAAAKGIFVTLSFAAENGHEEALGVLLASIDSAMRVQFCQRTAPNLLTRVAEKGHLAVLRRLLEAGLDLRSCKKQGAKALTLAMLNNHDDVAEELVRVGGGELAQQEVDLPRPGYALSRRADSAALKAIKPARAMNSMAPAKVPAATPAAAIAKASEAELLEHAYRTDDVAAMRRLLRTPAGKAWARECKEGGINALMNAAFAGKTRAVEALLEVDNGKLAEGISMYGSTALLLAAGAGHVETVKILLKFDKGRLALQRSTFDGKNALMMAAARGHSACVQLLLAWNGGRLAAPGELTKSGENALILAAQEGHADVVRMLLGFNGGVQAEMVTRRGQTAMTLAAEYNQPEVVRVLMGWGQGDLALMPNSGGYTPLLLAAREGHVTVLSVLLETPQADTLLKFCLTDGRDALALAAENGHSALVRLLLSHRIDPHKPTWSGENALMLAAKNGHIEVVRTLLLLTADGEALMRQRSNAGDTAPSLAKANGHVEVHDYLRRYEQTVSRQTAKAQSMAQPQSSMLEQRSAPAAATNSAPRHKPHGDDALLLAIQRNDLAMVKKLLDQHSFATMVGYQNDDGEGAVRVAVRLRRMDIMKVLINKIHWSLLIEDDRKPSAMHIALENRDAAMLQLMLDHIPAKEMDFSLMKSLRRGIQVALENGDSACLVLLMDCAQAFLRPKAFAQMLAGLWRPPADDAHRTALAMIDVKRAVLAAMLANGSTQEQLTLIRRDVEREVDAVKRLAEPDERGGS